MKEYTLDNLFEERRFCVWQSIVKENGQKPLKIPYCVVENKLQPLNIKRQKFWLTGYEALQVHEQFNSYGIGLILINSNLFALDLDNCYDSHTGQLSEVAQEIVNHFQNTYTEISPSGNGLHIIGLGKLNLNQRNRSPLNKHVEAYDGSSVRYITITTKLLKSSKVIYQYNLNHESIKWFQNKFFPRSDSFPKLASSSFGNISDIKIIDDLVSKIQTSKHKKVFAELCQGIRIKQSPSEDDLFFGNLAIRYLQKEDMIVQKEVLTKILLKYRYRSKLRRTDYLNRTVNKVVENFSTSSEKKIEIQPNALAQINNPVIPSTHLIKSCVLMQSLFKFSSSKFSNSKSKQFYVEKKKNSNNYLKVWSHSLLDVNDLIVYLALIKLLKTKTYVAEQAQMYMQIRVKFSELSKIVRKPDGSNFRQSILKRLKSLSKVSIEYQKSCKSSENQISGSSHLLDCFWYDSKLYLNINMLSWEVLRKSVNYYCLINIDVFFKLPTSELRWLYNFLCFKVYPGLDHEITITVNTLVKAMWPLSESVNVQKIRKVRVRKLCTQFYTCYQHHLVDFKIRLIHKTISSQLITGIAVKRKRCKIQDVNSINTNQYILTSQKENLVDLDQEYCKDNDDVIETVSVPLYKQLNDTEKHRKRKPKVDLDEIPF